MTKNMWVGCSRVTFCNYEFSYVLLAKCLHILMIQQFVRWFVT